MIPRLKAVGDDNIITPKTSRLLPKAVVAPSTANTNVPARSTAKQLSIGIVRHETLSTPRTVAPTEQIAEPLF